MLRGTHPREMKVSVTSVGLQRARGRLIWGQPRWTERAQFMPKRACSCDYGRADGRVYLEGLGSYEPIIYYLLTAPWMLKTRLFW